MADIINPHTGRPVEWGAYDDGHFSGDPFAWRKVLEKSGKWDGFTQLTPEDVESLRSAGYFDRSRLDGPGEIDPEVMQRYQATDWQRLRDMVLQMGLARKDYNLTHYIRDRDGNILDETTWRDKGSSMHSDDWRTAALVVGGGALAGYGLAANGIGLGASTGTLGTIAPSAATAASSSLPTVGTMATPTAASMGVGAVPTVGAGSGAVGTMGTIGAGSLASTPLASTMPMVGGVINSAVPAMASVPSAGVSGALIRGGAQLATAALMPSVKTPSAGGGPTSAGGAGGSSFTPPTRQAGWQDSRIAEMRAKYSPANSRVPSVSARPQAMPAPVSATPPTPSARVTVPGRPTGMTAQRVMNPAQQDIDQYSRAWQA